MAQLPVAQARSTAASKALRRSWRCRLAAALCLSLAIATAQAAPLNIEANSLSVERNTNTATFSGNVKAMQQNLTLTSNTLSVNYTGGAVRTVTAEGNVRFQSGSDTATGNRAVYTPTNNQVVLTGTVVLTQNGTTLTGERLVYNLKTGLANLTSSGSGRVKAVILPQENNR